MKKKKKNRIISYSAAIGEALSQEMERDPAVFLYGLDVADHKRTSGSTFGILEQFGNERMFSTPLSEEALMGVGLGAAIAGLRPVNIHIRSDFLLLAMNQLGNMVSSYHYGSGGKLKVPLVIRSIIGRGWGQGFQHSKSMQSIFAHIPGLKVVMPVTPYDVKGLLISAIRDNNPVIVLEHRQLYWVEGDVPREPYQVPIGKGKVFRSGRDITIVATSWMNVEAYKAAGILEASHGIQAEIIDPRTIYPLDEKIIIQSVEKTGHCIVADYDWLFCGFSAEVAALVQEKCFKKLKSPVTRIGFPHTHCATTRALENVFYPNSFSIVRSVEKKLGLKPASLPKEDLNSWEHKFRGPF